MTYEPRKTEHFRSRVSPGVLIEKWCDNPYRVAPLCWDDSVALFMTPVQARAYANAILKAADAAEWHNKVDEAEVALKVNNADL